MNTRTSLGVCALVAAAVAACDAPRRAPPPVDLTPSCGADRLQGLIGQDIGVISELDREGPLRVVRPGDAITQDYRPDRLNIQVDETGLITRVWCV